MKRLPLALLLLLAACAPAEPPRPAPGERPPTVRVIAENVSLLAGADGAVRIGFEPAGDRADLRVDFQPDTARVSLCPLRGIDGAIDEGACRHHVGAGVREPIVTRDLGAVAIVLRGGTATADVSLEYGEEGRRVEVRLPILRAPADARVCADNACNPFVEVLPTRSGSFEASARWEGPPATLVLLQGRVRARAMTGTGVPYREAARADGASPLSIDTRLSAPGEYALALRREPGGDRRALTGIRIEGRWP